MGFHETVARHGTVQEKGANCMGRRLKGFPESKAVIEVDKVGEEIDLSLCPICAGHALCAASRFLFTTDIARIVEKE